jgi:hypothetical protein
LHSLEKPSKCKKEKSSKQHFGHVFKTVRILWVFNVFSLPDSQLFLTTYRSGKRKKSDQETDTESKTNNEISVVGFSNV